MNQKIIINSTKNETRIGIIENSKLVELFLEKKNEINKNTGNIYKGKVKKVIPGLQAAFVDIGLKKTALIHANDITQEKINSYNSSLIYSVNTKIENFLRENNELMVQITRDATGTKGARVTSNISIPGRFLIFKPKKIGIRISKQIKCTNERNRLKNIIFKLNNNKHGYIIRTAAKDIEEEKLKDEVNFLNNFWFKLKKKYKLARNPSLIHQEFGICLRVVRDLLKQNTKKIIVDSKLIYNNILSFLNTYHSNLKKIIELYVSNQPIFEVYNLEKEIRRSLNKKLWLKSGGFIVLEHTEALTAIDVNTGRFLGKYNFEETATKTNIEAAKEIARQIRLQNISGIIIIDFIDMKQKSNQEKIFNELINSFSYDRNKIVILPMSRLGLIQIARKKTNEPIKKILCEPCMCCKGKGYRITKYEIINNIYQAFLNHLDIKSNFVLKLFVNPEIALYLKTQKKTLIPSLEKKLQTKILIEEEENYNIELFHISLVKVL